jgi:prepilin-type processing-associated H-X9-DG protein
MVSYVTSLMFQAATGPDRSDLALFVTHPDDVSNGSFHPKLNQIGSASRKIFMSDGAKWANVGTAAPDYNLGWDNSGSSPGGHYADYGPWSTFTRSFLRPNQVAYAMRHGSRTPGQSIGNYRFNAVFFDGHAETLDGVTGMNPVLWLPKGSFVKSSEMFPEAQQAYLPGGGTLNINE